MAMALVVHFFMKTDDHEWRPGHGDTLHSLFFIFSFKKDGLLSVLHRMVFIQNQRALLIEGTKVTYVGMAYT
jgi:hypothetical protein